MDRKNGEVVADKATPVEAPYPSVTVVVPTRDRPALVRRALHSFFRQTSGAIVEIIVVFDQSLVDDLPDMRAVCPKGISLRTVANHRRPGLAGARNTGIELATGELVAFCDDDDEWLPHKLQGQLDLWQENPWACAVGTGMRIQTEEASRTKRAPARMSFDDFLATREFSIPSSGLLCRKADLIAVGMVDENLPAAYGEDWDLLLRLSRDADLINVQEPVVVVHWNRPSFYAGKWQGIAAGLTYMLEKYPEFYRSRTGVARMSSQIGFANAALGHRREAVNWAWRSIRHDPLQVRAWATLPVATGIISAGTLVSLANRRGRGL